jgi:hypothetical protein
MSAQFDMLTQHNHPSSQGEEEGKVHDEDTAPSPNSNVANPSSPGVAPFDFEHEGQLGSHDIPTGDKKPAAKSDETDSDDIPEGDKKPAAKPDETDREDDSNSQHRLSGRQRRRSQRKSLATQLPIPNCENASFNVPCLPHTHTDCSTLLTLQCMKTTSSLTTFASMSTHPVMQLQNGPNGVLVS